MGDWLWLVWAVAAIAGFVALEVRGLRRDDDYFEPLTYYVRKYFRLHDRAQPLYWLVAAFIGWLALHFLIQS